MAVVYVTIKIMPNSPEADLSLIEKECRDKIEKYGAKVHSINKVPIAFGLVSLEIVLMVDEKRGSTEELEAELSRISGVESVQVVDVRRGIG
ncbi:MAG: elongation factor 1-beta [Candidatus Woesearchaeota archaeon]